MSHARAPRTEDHAIVSTHTPRLRAILTALAAVALTAGVALAARPETAPPAAADDGLDRASDAAGRTVPAVVEVPVEAPDVDEEEAPEATPTAEDEEDEEAATRPENHGWFVSQAAQAETPAGYDNHGAWVSSVARSDEGKPEAAADGEATAGDAGATGKARAAEAKAAAAERKAQRNGGD
jgi:hypothetical protein